VARTRQRQLFILTIFLICIGTAWLITTSGASLAIGAFLAGLIVSGSEYRHQALADMISFREVFASLFFVSVGMLLAPLVFIDNIVFIMTLLIIMIVGKALIVFVSALILRMPLRVCLLAGLALAQVGEFALVLSFAAKGTGLIEESLESSILSAAILSMFITPFAMAFGPKLAAGIGKLKGLTRLLDVATAEDATSVVKKMRDHVIIGGYGFAGRELARALIKYNIPFVIVDLNVENVRRASKEAGNAYFGDLTSQEVLERLGIESAREFVLLINDPSATERAVKLAREIAPKLSIIVRTRYLLDIKPILTNGADEVIPAEREAAVMITSRILERHQVDNSQIVSSCTEIRNHTEEKEI
jgi:CPA2 family monovalent cation:H+ antiporter-2